jgi:hypothetical protein
MATYEDKGLMMGANLRCTVLNSGDTNTITPAHAFKATTTLGALVVDQAEHNSPADNGAGKVVIRRDGCEVEVDSQTVTINRDSGASWNLLSMRGPNDTSSVIAMLDGPGNNIGSVNNHGARLGFCGDANHVASIGAGGLGVNRAEAFFLQVGTGVTVRNVLDVSITDGEVYFYQALRSTDADSFTQVNTGDVTFTNTNASHNTALPISGLYTYGLNASAANKEYASIKGFINSDAVSLEEGRLQFNIMRYGTSVTGLEVYPGSASETLVKVANAYTLPSYAGVAGQVLTAGSGGSSSWTTLPPDSDTLDSVTDRGATTTNAITTGDHIVLGDLTVAGSPQPSATGTYSIGSSLKAWKNIYLSAGAVIYYGNDANLTHVNGEGLLLNMTAEGNGEPVFKIKSDSVSDGPTFRLNRDTQSTTLTVGAADFTAQNDSAATKTFAALTATSPSILSNFERGDLALSVMSGGTVKEGIKVSGNPSISFGPIVTISDAYYLPEYPGSASQVLITDGSGGTYWGSVPFVEQDTLLSVTGRGSTTSSGITVNGTLTVNGAIEPDAANSRALGSPTLSWSDLYLGSGGEVIFGDTASTTATLTHRDGYGLDVNLGLEGNGEPILRVVCDTIANSIGPTIVIAKNAGTSVGDTAGSLNYQARNAGGSLVDYATISVPANGTTTGAHNGGLVIKTAVGGVMTDAITVNNSASTIVRALQAVHSGGNDIQLVPGSTTNLMRMTSASDQKTNTFAMQGATGSASTLTLTETGLFGSSNYAGARLGYSGDATWTAALDAPGVNLLFLQVGNNTDGVKNVLSVPNDDNTVTFHGNLEISGQEYNTNPTLSLVNDKGAYDLQISSDDALSTVTVDCALSGLTISTATGSLATLTLDSANIVLDASGRVKVYDDGVHLFSLPDANDPATLNHVLIGGGVGQPLLFSQALTGLTSVAATTVTATTLNVNTITATSSITVNKPVTFDTGSDLTLVSGVDIQATSSNINALYLGANQGSIASLASTIIDTTYQTIGKSLDVGGALVSGQTMPAWAQYSNTYDVSGVMLQQIGQNLLVAEDNRSGYWLIARDSTATNAPATPSDVGWLIQGMDSADYTMQNLYFRRTEDKGVNLSLIGYLSSQAAAGVIDFTGQHRSVASASAPAGIESMIGYIVVSDGTYSNLDGVTTKPTINEALPRVTLSSAPNQKSVYGVISDAEDANETERHYSTGAFISVFEKSDNRLIINAVGEGAVWVTDINGPIDNGDFITSSVIPGHGMKQADDLMHNYTVAKATQSCAFDLNSEEYDCEEYTHDGMIYRRALIGCTYHCG